MLGSLGCAQPRILSAGGLSGDIAEALEAQSYSTARDAASASVILIDRLLDVSSGVRHTESLAEVLELLRDDVRELSGVFPQVCELF